MAFRIDYGTELRPARRRDDGSVRVDAILTRSGVFTYQNADGSVRREYRPDSEVFAPESLETLSLRPVTDDHPPGNLTAANTSQYARGTTGETVRADGGGNVLGELAVTDAGLVAKMVAGKQQVSCGYECDLDMTPGVSPDGERYDAVQRSIRYNHVAVVDRGRAGNARVRMDAAVMVADGVVMDPEVVKKLTEAAAAVQKAEAERDAAVARADAAEAARDAALEKVTAADKARQDAVDSIDARVEARVALLTAAKPHLDKEFKVDGASDRDVRVAALKTLTGKDFGANVSDEYLRARFDAAVEAEAAVSPSLAAARKAAAERAAKADATHPETRADKALKTNRKFLEATGRLPASAKE